MRSKELLWHSIRISLGLGLLTAISDIKGNDLSLDIVATPIQAQEAEPILYAGGVFYVVLTNTSDKPIRIFEDWSSWGWFSLSFEATGADGKTYKIEKNPSVSFWRNFPAVFEILPRGHYVFAVQFDKDHWPTLEWFHKNLGTSEMRFLVKAVFTEKDTEGNHNVWQGNVESEARWFKVFQ